MMRLEKIPNATLHVLLKDMPARFASIILMAGCHTVWDGDKMIGMVGYTVNPGGVFVVQYIQVKDDMRRQGYGLKILKHLEGIAKKNKCYGMTLIFKDLKLEEFYRKASALIPMLQCNYVED